MTRPAASVAAGPSFTDRGAGVGRVMANGAGPWPKRQQRSAVGTRRDALYRGMILTALEQTQAIVGLVDGRIVHWSRGAELLYGWAANEAIGSRLRDLLRQRSAGAPEPSAAECEPRGIWRGELSRAHKDGRKLTIAAHCVSRRDLRGRAMVVELDHLIEPAGRGTDPLADPQADRQAGRVRQTEANGCAPRRMAHDFNNLLGIITLNLELARERAASGGEVGKMIDEALEAAWQGSELTSRLADLAPRLQ